MKKIIHKTHVLALKNIELEYKVKFSKEEKVIFENGNVYIVYLNNKYKLEKDDIVSIRKDILYEERLNNPLRLDLKEAAKALYDMDNPKYRLLIAKEDDFVNISYNEMINILNKHSIKCEGFECIAYSD